MFMGLAEAKTGSADGRAEPRESALLADDGVRMRFGGVTALEDVSFDVYQGAICGLIGPNGAGKTTLFNCISRLYDPHAGSIFFDRRPLASFSIHEIASLGIARTFQNVALFATMTTRDNVRVGAHALARGGFLANALALPLAGREERRVAERADALIDEFGLQRVADVPVGQLTFGARKRIELARARDRSEAVSARRAGGQPQSRGGRCARRRNPRHSRSAPRRDPVGRTSHEPRHAHL
jgi:branched-chain amino acid transport system ATP-binding protein